jgi:hypothetical protein
MQLLLSGILLFSIGYTDGKLTDTEGAFFARHPAEHIQIPPVKPKAVIHRGDRTFLTRLTRITTGKPNFADHLRIETWGCGTGCIMFGVADLVNGNTYLFPQTLMTPGFGRRMTFRTNSRMVHLVGFFNEDKPADRWFLWTGSSLKIVEDTPLPERCFYPGELAERHLPTAECNFQPLEEEVDGGQE